MIHCFAEQTPGKRVYQILRAQCASEATAHKWVQQFRALLRPADTAARPLQSSKKLKVLVNPFAGVRDARKAWQDVSFIFKLAGNTFHSLLTSSCFL